MVLSRSAGLKIDSIHRHFIPLNARNKSQAHLPLPSFENVKSTSSVFQGPRVINIKFLISWSMIFNQKFIYPDLATLIDEYWRSVTIILAGNQTLQDCTHNIKFKDNYIR